MAKSRSGKASRAATSDKYAPILVDFAREDSDPTDRNRFPVPSKEKFARQLKERIQAGIYGRKNFGFDDYVRRYRRYHDLIVTPKSRPWVGCSNIAPFIGRAIVETVHANLYSTIFSPPVWFHFESDKTGETGLSEVAERREIAFQSQVENQIKLRTKGDDLTKNALVDGTAITMTCYDYQVAKTVRMERITGPILAELLNLGYDGGKTAEQQATQEAQVALSGFQEKLQAALQQQAAQPGQSPSEPGMVQEAPASTPIANVHTKQAQDQQAQQAQAQIAQAKQQAQQKIAQAAQQSQEKEDQDLLTRAKQEFPDLADKSIGDYAPIDRKRDVIRDSPQVIPVDILDYVVYPANSKSQESDIFEGRRVLRSRDVLWRGVSSGIYDEDAVRDVTEQPSGISSTEEYMNGGDPVRTQRRGITVYAETVPEDLPYETFEGVYYLDVDGDGEEEKLYVEIALERGIVIRCEVYPYFHGKSPFDLYVPLRVPATQSRYGESAYRVMEWGLRSYKKVVDQHLDRGDLANAAPTAVDRRIQHDWSKNRWGLGMVVRCIDPNNAFVPAKIADVTPNTFFSIDRILSDVKTAAGVTDSQLLSASNAKTLGENDAMAQSSTLRMNVMVDRLKTAFGEMAQKIDYLNQQYHPEMLAPKMNDDGSVTSVTLTPEEMMQGMKITVHGNQATTNPEFRQQIAEKVYLALERAGYTADPVLKRRIMLMILHLMGQPDPETLLPTQQEVTAERENPKPRLPERTSESISRKVDEVANLAQYFKDGTVTPDEYRAAAVVAREVEQILIPPPQGADESAATDTAAGYSAASQEAAQQGNAQGVS